MFFKKRKAAEYVLTPQPENYVDRQAFQRGGLPVASYLGAGQLVRSTLIAQQPMGILPRNAQVITSPYGRGYEPNYSPVLQPLTLNDTGGSI